MHYLFVFSRGSPHVHGVLWLGDAPDVSNLASASQEELQKVAKYFDNLVTAVVSSHEESHDKSHPCRKMLNDIQDSQKDLAILLKTVQMHTKCKQGYCLRKHKQSGKYECRFKFPKTLEPQAKIEKNEANDVEFVPARNHPNVNKFNEYIIQSWRANIDIAPVLSKRALINYLAKYISKSETRSTGMDDMFNVLMDSKYQGKSGKHVIQSLLIQQCFERDLSAQEVCHLLLGTKLYSAPGRKFVKICFNQSTKEQWMEISAAGTKQCKSFVAKYQGRKDFLEDVCMWQVAKNYKLPQCSKYRKSAIVQVFPSLKFSDSSKDHNESYYRQQVLLYVPWRSTLR